MDSSNTFNNMNANYKQTYSGPKYLKPKMSGKFSNDDGKADFQQRGFQLNRFQKLKKRMKKV